MRKLVAAALLAALAGCADAPSPDPSRFVGATTLGQAIDRASLAYGVPRDLVLAIAFAETRLGDPRGSDHPHAPGDPHAPPEIGPLHLRRGAALDSLERARQLLGVGPALLRDDFGLAVAGATAVLAELGRATGARDDALESWVEAVARFSGFAERDMQLSYATQVFAILRSGMREQAFTGETLQLDERPALREAWELLDVQQTAQWSADYGPAHWVAASSRNFSSGRGGQSVNFIVVHDMEGSYAGSISWFRNPSAMASAHYCIRSSDGDITQMVDERDTAWHAGNFSYNQRSIGIEHEGFVRDPRRWFTEAMYVSSARLARNLVNRYRIPIDRQHIIGHYQIPTAGSGAPCPTSATTCGGAGRHTDPGNGGTGWNWDHYLDLIRGMGTPPPPSRPAWAAELVGVNCPREARSGERPVAWVEYRNTGTSPWDTTNTRLGTTAPRDHPGLFFDMINWLNRNRPTAVDRATAPGNVGRFSFVLGIPDVPTERTVTEHYGLVQEGVTWFGPADTAVTCAVRVQPRASATPDATPPPPRDATTPPEDTPAPPEDTPAPPEDAIPPLDAADDVTVPTDDSGAPGDAPSLEPDAAAPTLHTVADEDSGCACRTPPRGSPRASARALALAALALLRRRRR